MKYFKGKGYSKEFVSNFYKVMKELQDNPIVKVINHPGVICSSCPHNSNNKCIKKQDSEKKVKAKDNIIMKHLRIKPNQKIRIKDASNLVNINLEKLKTTCKDCQWKQYCN